MAAGVRRIEAVAGETAIGLDRADREQLDRLGEVTVKGISVEPHIGNQTPRTFETASGMLNAIGLPGPGAQGRAAPTHSREGQGPRLSLQ